MEVEFERILFDWHFLYSDYYYIYLLYLGWALKLNFKLIMGSMPNRNQDRRSPLIKIKIHRKINPNNNHPNKVRKRFNRMLLRTLNKKVKQNKRRNNSQKKIKLNNKIKRIIKKIIKSHHLKSSKNLQRN